MATILHFDPNKNRKGAGGNIDRVAEFVCEKLRSEAPSLDVIQFTTKHVNVTAMYIERSYEEMWLKMFTENRIMRAGGLTSMIVLTPDVTRDEIYEIAMVDGILRAAIPRIEWFVTAHDGGFEYNFRSVNHDIVQVSFQLLSHTG